MGRGVFVSLSEWEMEAEDKKKSGGEGGGGEKSLCL